MREALEAWWRARTERERLLLAVTLWLALLAIAPALVWQGANAYRSAAAADLRRAEALQAQVAAIDPAMAASRLRSGQDLQAHVTAAAAQLQLSLARVEPQGPNRMRFVFEPGDSLAALKLVDALTRAGLSVDRAAMVRVGETELVTTELDVQGAGS